MPEKKGLPYFNQKKQSAKRPGPVKKSAESKMTMTKKDVRVGRLELTHRWDLVDEKKKGGTTKKG